MVEAAETETDHIPALHPNNVVFCTVIGILSRLRRVLRSRLPPQRGAADAVHDG